MSEFSWGLFVALAASAIFVASGIPLGPLLVFGVVIGLFVAYRYPYFTFYVSLALMPFLGLTVSIPTGELAIGKRAFGGSIDIGLAEVLLLALLAAWALKLLWLWQRRRDRNWKPQLPLLGSYLSLIGAHLASAFSSLGPDRVLVAKFALRPVLFCYLAFVVLPVNFIRSRRKLVSALSVVSLVGLCAALNGTLSLFFVDATSQFIRRAHPLPFFGVHALGDNHNLLAELMVVTVMITLALAFLVKTERMRRLLLASAMLQGVIGLLTFSRTGWIVFAVQALFLAVIEYRSVLRRRLPLMLASLLLLIPFAFVMLQISSSTVATSSNSTRVALLEIALDVFSTSPWIGGGAGTFVERVGSAQVFRLEYGDPLDAHGFLQKLAAETGIFGLLAFAFVLYSFIRAVHRGLVHIPSGPHRRVVLLLFTGAFGAIVYQLFNTNYWTGKMWLPIGLTLAALRALRQDAETRESSEPV
ncbi:MAG: O-antigen ligase family protein [Patescibacteria group bacterium]|jgi:O-antigen ligase